MIRIFFALKHLDSAVGSDMVTLVSARLTC